MSTPQEIVHDLSQVEDMTELTDADLQIMGETLDLEWRETVWDPEPAAYWQSAIEGAQTRVEREIDRRVSVAEHAADRALYGEG